MLEVMLRRGHGLRQRCTFGLATGAGIGASGLRKVFDAVQLLTGLMIGTRRVPGTADLKEMCCG
jgi:hypothetical protein